MELHRIVIMMCFLEGRFSLFSIKLNIQLLRALERLKFDVGPRNGQAKGVGEREITKFATTLVDH
jgi:hypothetical protein